MDGSEIDACTNTDYTTHTRGTSYTESERVTLFPFFLFSPFCDSCMNTKKKLYAVAKEIRQKENNKRQQQQQQHPLTFVHSGTVTKAISDSCVVGSAAYVCRMYADACFKNSREMASLSVVVGVVDEEELPLLVAEGGTEKVEISFGAARRPSSSYMETPACL